MGLDSVELVLEIEDEFETKIPDKDAEHISTVRDVVDWLMQNDHSLKAKRMGRAQVLQVVRLIAAEQLGHKLETVSEDSRFVEDLGMN